MSLNPLYIGTWSILDFVVFMLFMSLTSGATLVFFFWLQDKWDHR